jgi:hypothetical protein
MDDATRRVRVDVPDFHGKLEPYAFQDWITSLEDYFDWSGLSLDRRVRFVKMKLKGQARVWWQSVEEHLQRLRQPSISDWGEMKMKLQEKYLPIDDEESLFEELVLLRQGNTSVDDYANKFHELSVRSQVAETRRQTLARFKAGLCEDIRKELLTMLLVSVEEAYQLALRIEQQLQATNNRRTQPRWGSPVSRGPSMPQSRVTMGNNQERFKPSNTSERNSFDDCRHKIPTGTRTERGKEGCYRCGGKGHYAIVCPTRDQKFTLVCGEEFPRQELNVNNNPVIEQEEATANGHEDDEILESSTLPVCVIRRILIGQQMV